MVDTVPRCPVCTGVVKPDIVFFGEMLPHRFLLHLADFPMADLLLILGTSLEVCQQASRCTDMWGGGWRSEAEEVGWWDRGSGATPLEDEWIQHARRQRCSRPRMRSREDAQRWRYPECRWAQCARGRGVGDVRREQVSQVVSQRPTLCRGS